MDNTIKTIAPTTCPHCFKDILVEFTSKAPELTSSFTIEAVNLAKKEVLEKLEALVADEIKKEEIKKWVEDENTVFGPGEVDSIIRSATNGK